jgi:exodeoxyribonuclease VII small subunit
MPPRKTATSSANNTADNAASAVMALGFEEAMAELEQLIQAVENNRLPLEETLQSYQRGQQLIARCNTLLRDAEQRIQQFDDEHLSDFTPPERA